MNYDEWPATHQDKDVEDKKSKKKKKKKKNDEEDEEEPDFEVQLLFACYVPPSKKWMAFLSALKFLIAKSINI